MNDGPNEDISAIRLAAIQHLESLQRAGVSHIPKPTEEAIQAFIASQTPVEPEVSDVKTSDLGEGALTMSDALPVFDFTKDDSLEARTQALTTLSECTAQCRACEELASTRTQTVFGVGNPKARLVFLGEAPGADEDRQGVPFVGRAGKLLTDIVEKGMKIPREEIYICNILRCRPPGNRNPSTDEAALCRKFLDATLDVIRPEFICCLGAVATQNLLESKEPIGKMRKRFFDYRGIRVICSYHPAYLLRNPAAKKDTWEDIQMLMREMGLPVE
jgi:uracil-DNA glycosylase